MTLATQYLSQRSGEGWATLEADAARSSEQLEFGIGTLLAGVWTHKEAMQVTNLPAFFELTRLVFEVRTLSSCIVAYVHGFVHTYATCFLIASG